MNLKEVSTVELVQEVLTRAQNIDALLTLVGGTKRIDAGPPAKAPRKVKGSRVSALEFFQGMRSLGRPATVKELARRFTNGDSTTCHGHIYRAIKRGDIIRLGDRKPHAYQLTQTNGAA